MPDDVRSNVVALFPDRLAQKRAEFVANALSVESLMHDGYFRKYSLDVLAIAADEFGASLDIRISRGRKSGEYTFGIYEDKGHEHIVHVVPDDGFFVQVQHQGNGFILNQQDKSGRWALDVHDALIHNLRVETGRLHKVWTDLNYFRETATTLKAHGRGGRINVQTWAKFQHFSSSDISQPAAPRV